jgi:hypothetical protein
MTRTLLPVFNKYSLGFNLDAKEPMENFSFLHNDRLDYEAFRDCLDGIPGSREYLKSYKVPEGEHAFCDNMGHMIMCGAGANHSGASAVSLGFQYKFLLNDWDSWVKAVKMREAKNAYTAAQLERPSTWQFAHSSTKDERASAIENLRTNFFLTYSDEEIEQMLTELIVEFDENTRMKDLKDEEERFQSRIKILEHHYKYPERWNDHGVGNLNSALFGSIYDITEKMIVAVEKKIPDYRSHINNRMRPHLPRCACGICHEKRIDEGTDGEYSAWVHAEAAAVLSRPPRSSVSVNPMIAFLSASAKAD